MLSNILGRVGWQELMVVTLSVNYKQERMGAGYAVGVGPVPLLELSSPVGGPLSTLRSEAASLHALLLKTPSTTDLLLLLTL